MFQGNFMGEKWPKDEFMHIEHPQKIPGKVRTAAGAEVKVPEKPDPDAYLSSVRSIPLGDVISVRDLLKLADPRGEWLLDAPREKGENSKTLRNDGGVISVNIE